MAKKKVTKVTKKSPKKNVKKSGKTNEQQSREYAINKNEIVTGLAMKYNELLGYVNGIPGSVEELKRAGVSLEESYLWARTAVEKKEIEICQKI